MRSNPACAVASSARSVSVRCGSAAARGRWMASVVPRNAVSCAAAATGTEAGALRPGTAAVATRSARSGCSRPHAPRSSRAMVRVEGRRIGRGSLYPGARLQYRDRRSPSTRARSTLAGMSPFPAVAAAEPRRVNWPYAHLLWFLLFLFCLRVVGQGLVAAFDVPFLPAMNQWYSGVIPYPILLPVQVLIIFL